MQPTLGRIVLHRGIESNVATVHPAVITRVWSDECVNLTVFPDNDNPTPITSQNLVDPDGTDQGWFWPIREGA